MSSSSNSSSSSSSSSSYSSEIRDSDWESLASENPIEVKDIGVSTESDADCHIKCAFCTRNLHEKEDIIILDECGHIICPTCFQMLKHYPNRKPVCPLCFKVVSNFK